MENPAPKAPPAAPEEHAPQVPAEPAPGSKKTDKIGRFGGAKALLSIVLFIGGVIIAAALINQFVFQSYYVDGTSMTPTLHNNDRLIIDKVERTGALVSGHQYVPQRGQIVVLDSSLIDQYGRNEQLIKRVIGLPGDRIVVGTDGTPKVFNKEHPDGFDVNKSLGLHLAATYVDMPLDITVPNDSIFVMGDNRAPGGSFDSRSFGPVQTKNIQGRLIARIFPFNATGFF
jgi:signal peptidase I